MCLSLTSMRLLTVVHHSGGVQVEARQIGAEWQPLAEEGLYELHSCPTGHYIHAPTQLLQQCLPCEAGTHCPHASCTACSPCPAGTFKQSAGSYDCRECPRHTFQPELGARSPADCVGCPAGSFTSATAQSSLESCECEPTLYPAGAPFGGSGELECVVCPQVT